MVLQNMKHPLLQVEEDMAAIAPGHNDKKASERIMGVNTVALDDGEESTLDRLLADDSRSSCARLNTASNTTENKMLETGNSSTMRRVVSEDISPGKQDQHPIPNEKTCLLNTVSPTSSPLQEYTSKANASINSSTVLSSLVSDKKYLEANRRVREYPEEASIWVTYSVSGSPREKGASKLIAPGRSSVAPGDIDAIKCLPIHKACANLATASESRQRFQLEQLILKLALTFPDGCSFMDGYGQSPLLLAIWNNATPETISMLLMADPASVNHKDSCGRNASEVNRHRCGVFAEQVKDLLSMGIAFWEEARHKAADKFQNQNFASTTVSKQPSVTSFSVVSEQGADGYPDSSLTEDEHESDSLLSETFPSLLQRQERLSAIFRSANTVNEVREHAQMSRELPSCRTTRDEIILRSKDAEPDSRESILQSLLTDMYEKNQRLNTTINELSEINSNLHKQIEKKPQNHELFRQVEELNKEKRELENMLAKYQLNACATAARNDDGYDSEDDTDKPFDEKEQDSVCGISRATRHDIIALRDQNKALQNKITRLKMRKEKQAEKIQYLKSIVACTREDILTDFSSETESASTFSMLESMGDSAARISLEHKDNDDYSSTASSFRRRLASSSQKAAETTKESLDADCFTANYATYRLRDYVTRLQRSFQAKTKKRADPSPGAESELLQTDNIDEICVRAAEIYSEHVRQCPWRNGELIIQWEPPAVIRKAPLDPPAKVDKESDEPEETLEPRVKEQDLPIARDRDPYDNAVPMIIPVRYRVADVNNELGSIVSYSETSLSSIGMHSLGDQQWI